MGERADEAQPPTDGNTDARTAIPNTPPSSLIALFAPEAIPSWSGLPSPAAPPAHVPTGACAIRVEIDDDDQGMWPIPPTLRLDAVQWLDEDDPARTA